MRKVSASTSASGSHLNSSGLQPKDSPSKVKPSVIQAKSEQKGFNALKNCSDTKKIMSPDTSRRHVEFQTEKKSLIGLFGKFFTKNVKDNFQNSSLIIKEHKFTSPEQTNFNHLSHGLNKFINSENTHSKQQLSFSIKQCLGLADGDPTNENLQKLEKVAHELKSIPGYYHQSKALIQKIETIIEKRKETVSKAEKNMVMADKQIMPSSPDLAPAAELQTVNKAEIITNELDDILADLNNDISNASGKAKTDDITNELDSIENELNDEISKSSASAKTITNSDELERELKAFNDAIIKLTE